MLAAATLLTAAAPALAADLVSMTSPHSVTETLDRLENAVTEAGATIFARVDHAEGAAEAGMELNPAQVLIFGNPKLGTPAMQDAATAGLDLPMRVLAYADEDGIVHVAYHPPAALAETHDLPAGADYLEKMSGALQKLTAQAVAD
jgi:uncharacterized protein (DUF302 family)